MGKEKVNVNIGQIEVDKIRAAHEQIKQIVSSYKEVNLEVSKITQEVKDNWVGDGRNEFDTQYRLLISKIDDFGETLQDIYDALVQAEADYAANDDSLRQQYVQVLEK